MTERKTDSNYEDYQKTLKQIERQEEIIKGQEEIIQEQEKKNNGR